MSSTILAAEPALEEEPAQQRRSLISRPSRSDVTFRYVARAAGITTVAVMLAVGVFLSLRAGDALSVAGPAFLVETKWSPETGVFGIGAVLFGTVSIAIIAMTVAVPLAMGTSLLISELLGGRLRAILISLVDLMAAVPSVISVIPENSVIRPETVTASPTAGAGASDWAAV